MKLCRVIGPVVSTVKHPTYLGTKLLAVQPVDAEDVPTEDSFLAVDRVQAGEGDLVLIMSEGNGVRQLYGMELLPIRSIIVAIVDEVDRPGYGSLEPGEPL
jgi:ethanolamine utilization protein EutN